ncbi:hypothetical protein D3C72_1157950 [compost metagenome]
MIETLGQKVLFELEKRGVSQAFAAKQLGVTRQYVNKLGTKKTFSIEFLERLRDKLGIDFVEQADYKEAKIEPQPRNEEYSIPETGDLFTITLNLELKAKQTNYARLPELITIIKAEAQRMGITIK